MEFYCNYNEVTSSNINKNVLEIILKDFTALEYLEYKGNTLSRKLKKDFILRY